MHHQVRNGGGEESWVYVCTCVGFGGEKRCGDEGEAFEGAMEESRRVGSNFFIHLYPHVCKIELSSSSIACICSSRPSVFALPPSLSFPVALFQKIMSWGSRNSCHAGPGNVEL